MINRQALFDALASAGITTVTVEFNGYGDEGQIESILYFIDGNETSPAIGDLMFARRFVDGAPDREPVALNDAVEELLYALLSRHYGGWQDNDGSYGTFSFDIAASSVDLDINLRFVDSNNYQHSF